MLSSTRLTFKKTSKKSSSLASRHASSPVLQYKSQKGWIMLETLFSLVLLIFILHFIQQQTQEHWQSITQLEQEYQLRFQQTQIDKLRRMKQDSTWLQGQWVPPSDSECLTCEGTELNDWALYWLSNGQDQVEFEAYLSL